MIEKYFIKWAAPAREDMNEIIEHIVQNKYNIRGKNIGLVR
jgi:hypothetical protein